MFSMKRFLGTYTFYSDGTYVMPYRARSSIEDTGIRYWAATDDHMWTKVNQGDVWSQRINSNFAESFLKEYKHWQAEQALLNCSDPIVTNGGKP